MLPLAFWISSSRYARSKESTAAPFAFSRGLIVSFPALTVVVILWCPRIVVREPHYQRAALFCNVSRRHAPIAPRGTLKDNHRKSTPQSSSTDKKKEPNAHQNDKRAHQYHRVMASRSLPA